MLLKIADMLEEIPKDVSPIEETHEKVVYRYEKRDDDFKITRDPDGAFVISGEKIERLLKMTDFTQYEATQRFARQMRAMGIDDALRERGIKDGETVRILDFEFEFVE